MIEAMVFGINAAVGNFYEPKLCITLVLSIAVVYVTVNFVMFVNAQRSAVQFNQNLRLFQEQMLSQTHKNRRAISKIQQGGDYEKEKREAVSEGSGRFLYINKESIPGFMTAVLFL